MQLQQTYLVESHILISLNQRIAVLVGRKVTDYNLMKFKKNYGMELQYRIISLVQLRQ